MCAVHVHAIGLIASACIATAHSIRLRVAFGMCLGIFCQFDCVLYMSMQFDDFQVHQQQQQQHHLVGCCQFSSSRSSSSSSTRLSSTNVSAIYVIKNNSLRGNTVTGCFCASAQNQITTIETYLIEHEAKHCV